MKIKNSKIYVAGPSVLNRPVHSIIDMEQETGAVLSSFTEGSSFARAQLVNDLIVSLKTAGVWDKLGLFYVLAADDEQAARINWKNPGSGVLSAVNSPVFTQDRGFTGTGASWLNTGVAASGVPGWSQDNAMLFGWFLDSGQDSGAAVGGQGTYRASMNPRTTADRFTSSVNAGTVNFAFVTASDASGLSAADRSNSTQVVQYKNGTAWGTLTQTSYTPGTGTLGFLRAGGFYSAVRQIAAGGWGASLTAGEHAALYSALSTYLTAVGAI